eukprot:5727004-Pyramimonas_sp.AAC.1
MRQRPHLTPAIVAAACLLTCRSLLGGAPRTRWPSSPWGLTPVAHNPLLTMRALGPSRRSLSTRPYLLLAACFRSFALLQTRAPPAPTSISKFVAETLQRTG